MTAVREHGTPLVDDPARLDGVAALGVDETAFLAANAKHPTIFVTGMVDLTARQLLDVVPGRSAKALHDWVSGQSEQWRAGVTVAALDPFRGYATALSSSLPKPVRVLDAFHVTRLGFAAVDEVRRRVQQETLGHRGRRDDPLYRIRRVLRRAAEHLTPTAWERKQHRPSRDPGCLEPDDHVDRDTWPQHRSPGSRQPLRRIAPAAQAHRRTPPPQAPRSPTVRASTRAGR